MAKRQLFVLQCEDSLKLKESSVDLLGSFQHNTCFVWNPCCVENRRLQVVSKSSWFVCKINLCHLSKLFSFCIQFKCALSSLAIKLISSQMWFRFLAGIWDILISIFQSGKWKNNSVMCKYVKTYTYLFLILHHSSVQNVVVRFYRYAHRQLFFTDGNVKIL